MNDTDTAGTSRSTGDIRRLRLVTVLLVALALVPFVQNLSAQPQVRYAQTAALVDHRTVELDRYRAVVGIDHVERDGHLYGDKAPLQPILAAPAYAAARMVGAEPATHPRTERNLGAWWVTVWSTVVPLLVVAAMGVTVATRLVGSRAAVLGTLGIVSGTLLLAYGTQLYAHVLAGLLGWACWVVLVRPGHSTRTALAAGVLGGAAVATEYPMAIVVLVCAGVLVHQRAWKRLVAYVAGGLPFVGLLLGYQWLAYGNPFTVSYNEKPVHDSEALVVGAPNPVQLIEVLFGSRGLIVFTPVVAVAIVGLWRLAKHGAGERRLHGVVGLVVFTAFVLLQAGWSNPWGGEAPGPRYVVPALPFLILGLAEIWDRAGRWHIASIKVIHLVVGWSIFAMATTVLADHLVPAGSSPVAHHLRWMRDHGTVDTLWTMLLGSAGWVVHALTVAAAIWLVRRRLTVSDPGVPAG